MSRKCNSDKTDHDNDKAEGADESLDLARSDLAEVAVENKPASNILRIEASLAPKW